MQNTITHFINGEKIKDNAGRSQEVYNPATGEVTSRVLLADVATVNAAVAAAKAALPQWRNTTITRRARILFRYKELLEKHSDEIAALITAEHGKTLIDAKGSLQRGIETVEFACGAPHLLKGEFAENVGSGVDAYSIRQPLGVCVGITPFNFPAMIPNWMFPMALVCGNTFVLKPSERDPSTPMRLVELMHEAGLPPGVLNLVNGDKMAVDTLLTHPDVAGVSFVGSTPVAEYVHHTAIQHHKRARAFGGAKNHMVIMPDADLDQVANAVVGAAYGSAGERCMAISVAIIVGEKSSSTLIEKIKNEISKLRIGPGNQANIDMGPVITQAHRQRIISYIDSGVAEGAKLLIDGRSYACAEQPKGFFIGPSLFDQVTPSMKIYQEEIFGPVLCLIHSPTLAEAIELINHHPFANGTAIFTNDGQAAREFAERIEVGMVGVNIPIPVPMGFLSFGGWRRSRFGDIHMNGSEDIHFYTQLKNVTARWPGQTKTTAEFAMPILK